MKSGTNQWTNTEKREVLLIALLPFASAVLLAVTLFISANPSAEQIMAKISAMSVVFGFTILSAYISLLFGVMPLLLLFKRLKWQTWFHHALAGYVGVVLPWFALAIAILALGQHSPSSLPWVSLLAVLSVPGAIAGVAAVTFWFFCRRHSHVQNSAQTSAGAEP